MLAFHSFWSEPNISRHGGIIDFNDADLLVMILSALKWKQLNGPILMISDSPGAEFFYSCGLEDLWTEPIITELDVLQNNVDSFLFWAAGKLKALSLVDVPCVMLDTDMIIWSDLNESLRENIVCAHFENIDNGAYPEPSVFQMKDGYQFDCSWDFTLQAANTAFLYIPKRQFRDYYVESAFHFINSLDKSQVDPIVSMCFAEQRLLPMCAKASGIKVEPLLDMNNLDDQCMATHIWGYKSQIAASSTEMEKLCMDCVGRIIVDFPEWEDRLLKNKRLQKYVLRYQSDKAKITH